MADEMKGMVAIVTGGGGDIGRATCLQLAERGVQLAVVDVALDRAEAVANEAKALGVEAIACGVDVTVASAVEQAVRRTVERFGRVDILVNTAGIYQPGTLDDVDEAAWDRMIDVNLKGNFLFCKAVVPHMQRQRAGAIVSVSSISGRTQSRWAAPHYTSSKAGVIGLTMALANQLAADGIRVNCVAPGSIDTTMLGGLTPEQRRALELRTPLGRLGRPEEIAAAIVFLASPAASYITGETLNVNGGAFMI